MAIQGLDTSSPDDIVKDGACSALHNLRWKDNAWRPVHPHKKTLSLLSDEAAEMEIVYHHPAAGENVYIAYYKDEPKSYATITFKEDEPPIIEGFATIRGVTGISHFGNVLIFETSNSVVYYLFKDSAYKKITFPPYARLSISDLNTAAPEPTTFWAEVDGQYKSYPYSLEKEIEISAKGKIEEYITDIANLTSGEGLLPNNGDRWRGEILVFSTWQLEDGTNLCPSPLLLINSSDIVDIPSTQAYSVGVRTEGEGDNKEKILQLSQGRKRYDGTFTYKTQALSSILPTIDIRISKDWDYSAVKYLVIWATRIHPTFVPSIPVDPIELARTKERFWFADNDLANQPFYKLAELTTELFADDPTNDNPNIPDDPEQDPDDGYIDDEYDPSEGWDPDYDWGDGWEDERDDWGAYALSAGAPRNTSGNMIYSITLNRSTLEAIITRKKYEPNNNAHLLYAANPFDYNNRFHYYNYKQVLAKGYHVSDSNNTFDSGEYRNFSEWLTMEIDGKTYNVVSSSKKQGYSLLEGTPMYNIISYPDIRAKRYAIEGHFDKPLESAINNSFAWYKEQPTKFAKFPPISLDINALSSEDIPINSSTVVLNNKVQVTSSNNLFSMPFENNYAVGSSQNRIIALQSAAIKIGDEKVGSLPLYVFTTEGIFALRAGESTLYAAVNPINYDKIINPNTLAINGAVVYITEKGVHLLSEQGTAVISTPIHSADGMPPLHFLRTCKILWPKQYNEIVLHNEAMNKAYVYNLDSGYWSTRTLNGTKLNTDEMVYDGSIYDLADEDETQCLNARIQTRPIKLGNVEFKRLETIIPRMNTGNHNFVLDMGITGSVDGRLYNNLRIVDNMEMDSDKVNPLVLRRTPFSAKYFEMVMELTPMVNEDGFSPSITHIDFEWYTRFMRRMR